MVVSGDAVVAVVGALAGAALGLFGTLFVSKLERRAGQADRIEQFQRDNLLKLQDLMQEYFIVTSKWLSDRRPGDFAGGESFQRVRIQIDDCRARADDETLRGLIKTLVHVNVSRDVTDYKTLANAYVGPCKPIRDRIDELLHPK